MSFASKTAGLLRCARAVLQQPRHSALTLAASVDDSLARDLARGWRTHAGGPEVGRLRPPEPPAPNPLREYFDSVTEGPGIYKWLHYFDIYDRHLRPFVGRDVTVVEIGVYSGGSLVMWQRYFGPECRIHGVDIQEECRVYESALTTIHVGDQADRSFWRRFREAVPWVDVVIDDGGHTPEQQRVTLEEMLPHVRPGGVFICEDIHGVANRFAAFTHSLADELNAIPEALGDEPAIAATPLQASIDSIHLYPFVAVIEKRRQPLRTLSAPRHGSEWQSFP